MRLYAVEVEVWPPMAPDISWHYLESIKFFKDPTHPFYSVIKHQRGDKFHIKRDNLVFKMGGWKRAYNLHRAAGDCAITTRGRVMSGDPSTRRIEFEGYYMDEGIMLKDVKFDTPEQRKDLIWQMMECVWSLHHDKHVIHGSIWPENMLLDREGHLKLKDFEQGRWEGEDEDIWWGQVVRHYVSPKRRNRDNCPHHDSAPRQSDDLYALGLSIWSFWTGKQPFEDEGVWKNDEKLTELLLDGITVDVDLIDDEEVREAVRIYLRHGGADV